MNGGSRLPEQPHVEAISQRQSLETSRHWRLAIGALAAAESVVLTLGTAQVITHDQPKELQPAVALTDQPYHLPYQLPQHHAKPRHETAPTKTIVIKPVPKTTSNASSTEHVGRGYTAAVEHANVHPHHGHQGHDQKSGITKILRLFGVDLGWPNGKFRLHHIPSQYLGYGIVGITEGANFTTNSHLEKQAKFFPRDRRSLYVVPDFDGKKKAMERDPSIEKNKVCKRLTQICVAKQYGFDAGIFNVDTASDAGVYVPDEAVDIEPQKYRPWTENLAANAASIQAVMDGEKFEAKRLGLRIPQFMIYSTATMFHNIAGRWMPRLGIWLATGHRNNMDFALNACADTTPLYQSFGGGKIKIVQSGIRLPVLKGGKFTWVDVNVRCHRPFK